ncbi:MAG: hypothetical protein K2M11_07265 [Paramuribaculum sp.]|nr:hypothetical protein [Paramuribaculum sp.]
MANIFIRGDPLTRGYLQISCYAATNNGGRIAMKMREDAAARGIREVTQRRIYEAPLVEHDVSSGCASLARGFAQQRS